MYSGVRQSGWETRPPPGNCFFFRLFVFLFQIMARRWPGNKPRVTSHYLNQWWSSLLMHICVTRPQWINKSRNGWSFIKAGVKYVFVFVFKYANICICICICIWKTTRWNICICIWLAYLGVFDKYFSNTLFIFILLIHNDNNDKYDILFIS